MTKSFKMVLATGIFLLPLLGFSQGETIDKPAMSIKDSKAKYWNLGAGFSRTNFRDIGTSPLGYKGLNKTFSLEREKVNENREMELGGTLFQGNTSNTFNDAGSVSRVSIYGGHFSQMYKLDALSNDKRNVKIGGLARVFMISRSNGDLQNASSGREIFANLMGSIKMKKDISRKTDKTKKILFIKIKRPAVKRDFGMRFDLGLINSNYRNGFLYVGQSSVTNTPKGFDRYEFNSFSGISMGTEVYATKYLDNGNGIRLAYNWNAMRTSEEPNLFELAMHTVSFSFIFNSAQ